MMSGIEAAGLVLAVFPIVVNRLKHFAEGVETIRAWKSYRKKLAGYSQTLETAETAYLNTIQKLLEGIIESNDELAAFMNDPGAAFPQYEERLSVRLGHAYGIYNRIMADMLEALTAVRQELGIDENGKVRSFCFFTPIGAKSHTIHALANAHPLRFQILWDDYFSLERQFKRLKLAISMNRYKDLLTEIKEANVQLSKFTEESHTLDFSRNKRRSKGQQVDFKAIRRQARSLYNVMVTGRSWRCRCWKYHVASLRLEPRPWEEDKGKGNATEAPRLRFTVLLSSPCPDDGSEAPKWQELEIVPVETPESLIAGCEKNTQTLGIAKMSLVSSPKPLVKKAVHFTVTPSDEPLCSPAATEHPQIGTGPINDICTAVSKHCGVKQTIGFLTDESVGQYQHQISLANERLRQGVGLNSLEDLLQALKRRTPGFSLSRRDLLYIAVTLASSVLQLEGTLWLKRQWDSGDILFFTPEQKTSALGADYTHPDATWANVAHRVPCEVLFRLGITLTELCFGQNIYDMRIDEDIETTDVLTNFNTASRLIDYVYSESGSRYGDVVRRYLKCPPDIRDANLDNKEFQEAVFESIVTPLRQDFEDFNGGSRIR